MIIKPRASIGTVYNIIVNISMEYRTLIVLIKTFSDGGGYTGTVINMTVNIMKYSTLDNTIMSVNKNRGAKTLSIRLNIKGYTVTMINIIVNRIVKYRTLGNASIISESSLWVDELPTVTIEGVTLVLSRCAEGVALERCLLCKYEGVALSSF